MPISSLTRRALLLASTSLAASPAFGQMFSSITLSPQVFSAGATGAAPGTVVGTVTVTLAVGTFTGYLSLSSANFAVSGSNIVTVGTLAAGDYPLTITATQGCVVYSQAFNIIGTGLESQAGTTVPGDSTFIQASSTPGMAGAQNFIFLTSNNTIQVNNGTPFGAGVTQLYKIGGTVFQLGSGAWYEPVTASGGGTGPVSAPQPTVSLSGGGSVPSGSPSGTTIGTISVAVGAGTYSFALSLSDNTHFQLSGTTLQTKTALADGSYPLTISAASSAILHSPFTLAKTIQVGIVGGVAWPAAGVNQNQITSGEMLSLATSAGQASGTGGSFANNIMASFTAYNYYFQNTGNQNNDWAAWAGFDGDPNPNTSGRALDCFQITICPMSGFKTPTYGYNPSDWINNRQSYMQTMANNIANRASGVITVNIGWEWNSGGYNDIGFDANGQQTNYITWFRTFAGIVKATVPNAIIAWVMNSTLMHYGTPMDFYPGSDVVDAIGCECYAGVSTQGGGPSTVISTTDTNNNWGFLTVMSAQPVLGANHPAKATGSMTLSTGATVTIPTYGPKFIAIPEWQDNGNDSNFVTNAFTWTQNAAVKGRVLVMNYWQGDGNPTDSGSAQGNGSIMTVAGFNAATTNNQATQWLNANNGKTFPALPITKLS